jgi:hypothetical protein
MSQLQGRGGGDILDIDDFLSVEDSLPTIQNISIGLANLTATLFWLTAYISQSDVDPGEVARAWPVGSIISARQAVILNHLHVRLY